MKRQEYAGRCDEHREAVAHMSSQYRQMREDHAVYRSERPPPINPPREFSDMRGDVHHQYKGADYMRAYAPALIDRHCSPENNNSYPIDRDYLPGNNQRFSLATQDFLQKHGLMNRPQ